MLSEAYSLIFKFKIDKDNITFYDYEINDLCYVPENIQCPRKSRFLNENNKHKIIRSIFYGISLSEFDSALVYNKIYRIWQGIGKEGRVNSNKTYLYNSLNQVTRSYLVKGDEITILDEKIDDTNQKWYFINYKGKKDINMWIKAETVDIEE